LFLESNLKSCENGHLYLISIIKILGTGALIEKITEPKKLEDEKLP
jgi:hypothetical protein